jgi:hypothetical protein
VTRFTIDSMPDIIGVLWYVRDTLVPENCEPLVIAICNSRRQAEIVQRALTDYYVRLGQLDMRLQPERRDA